jgi:hypothetical protein
MAEGGQEGRLSGGFDEGDPSYRIGRAIRVRRKDVEEWLEINCQELGG